MHQYFITASGAGTDFKAGGGHTSVVLSGPVHLCGTCHTSGRARQNSGSTVGRFGKRFRDGQYNLVSLLFAVILLTMPPVPSHL